MASLPPQRAEDVRAALLALYGPAPLVTRGLVHVVATVHTQGARHALAIGPFAPKSATDFFVLSATRARADAILTSARNVRHEPDLSHAFPAELQAGLSAYRASLGKTEPPVVAILTAMGDLPVEHGVFADGTPKLVLTLPGRAAELTQRLGARAEVVAIPALSPRNALEALRARGHGLISLEAGPSTAAPLYDEPGEVDELLLTTYLGVLPDVRGVGPRLPPEPSLFRGLTRRGGARVEEPSGPFLFECFQRVPASPAAF